MKNNFKTKKKEGKSEGSNNTITAMMTIRQQLSCVRKRYTQTL